MATSQRTLTRIYDLRVLGGDNVTKALKSINQALEENAKLKAMASQKNVSAADIAEMEKYKSKIKELTVEELKLKAAQKEALNEKRAMSVATTEAANAAKKEADALEVAQGSYRETVKLMKELRPLIQNANKDSIINFQGQKLDFSQAIAEYKKLSAAEQDFRRQFTKDNTLVGEYTSGIVKAFQESGLDNLIKQQVERTKQQINSLDKTFEELKKELSDIGVTGKGGFERIENEMIENRNEATKLRASLAQVEQQMSGVGGVGRQVTTALNQGFREMRQSIGNVVIGYIGFQAALNQGTKLIGDAAEISDQLTELQVNMGGTAEETENLKKSLSGLDSRTGLKGLLEISDVALKAGTAKENLVGVTDAIDRAKTAFGKDFGSIEQGTETLAKLINIFYEDGEITGDRILKVSNSIRAIANESVASVPYITDFNGRMAGLKQVFQNFQLSESIGLAAGFEQFKQSAEVSSTVLVKVLPKLASDTEKYGKIVGMTADEFGKLINNNPVEALIQVSEALVKNGKGVEEISKALEDSELGAGRITTVLATLGGRADVFRDRIARAGETIESTDAITAAYTAKNENLAATLDKIKKKFDDVAGSKAFQTTLAVIGSLILFLIQSIPVLIGILSVLAAGWVIQNSSLILLNLQMAYYTVASRTLAVVQGILTVASRAYTISLGLMTGAYGVLTTAARLFTTVVRAHPLGILLTVVGLVAAGFRVFAASVNGSTTSLRMQGIQAKINEDIMKRVNDQIADQVSRINVLVAVMKDKNASLESQKRALDEAKQAGGEYLEGLTLQNVATAEGKRLIDQYIESLKNKAYFEAASAIQAEKMKEEMRLGMIEQKIQERISSGQGTDLEDLTEEEKKFVSDARKNWAFTASVTDLFTGGSAAEEALLAIKAQRSKLSLEIDATTDLIKDKYNKMNTAIAQGGDTAPATVKTPVEIDIEQLKADIKALDDQIEKYRGSQAGLTKLVNERAALQKRLDEALGRAKGGGSSRKDESATEILKRTYEAEKKQLETQFNDKKITEQQFEEELLKLATDFRERRLTAIKAANKKEKDQQISFNAELSKDQADADEKLFSILSEQQKAIMDQRINQAKIAQQGIDDDPQAGKVDKINAKLLLYKVELEAKRKFDNDMLALEQRFKVDNVKAAAQRRDELAEIERQIRKTAYELAVASFEERMRLIEEYNKTARGRIETRTYNDAIDILRNGKSPREQANALKELELRKTKELLDLEVKITQQAYQKMVDAYRKGLATYEQVNQAKNKAAKARLDYEKFISEQERSVLDRLTDGLRNAWSNISGFFRNSKIHQDEILAAVNKAKEYIASTIGNAKDAYFANQNEQIEREKDIAVQRLALEEQQMLSVAASEEEKEYIRRLYEDKRKDAERKASEDKKKVALKEAAMNYAMGMIQTLGAYPFPFSLIPAAGLTLAYLFQRSEIQKQKFEHGGEVPTKKGGPIHGPSHARGGVPFNYDYEAEGGELAIINKRSAAMNRRFTVSGTPKQIASAINMLGGGVSFASGARVRKLEYGGMLGSNLNAPADTSFLRNSGNSDLEKLIYEQSKSISMNAEAINNLMRQTNERIDRIKVELPINDVTKKQGDVSKKVSVGQLK